MCILLVSWLHVFPFANCPENSTCHWLTGWKYLATSELLSLLIAWRPEFLFVIVLTSFISLPVVSIAREQFPPRKEVEKWIVLWNLHQEKFVRCVKVDTLAGGIISEREIYFFVQVYVYFESLSSSSFKFKKFPQFSFLISALWWQYKETADNW